jgi:hypothetical protein
MIHRDWFAGLKNDAPPQLAIKASARVPVGGAEQPQSASETIERADFSTSGLQAVPLQQLDDEQIAALIKVGRELIADRKILIARLVLQRAAWKRRGGSTSSAARPQELRTVGVRPRSALIRCLRTRKGFERRIFLDEE